MKRIYKTNRTMSTKITFSRKMKKRILKIEESFSQYSKNHIITFTMTIKVKNTVNMKTKMKMETFFESKGMFESPSTKKKSQMEKGKVEGDLGTKTELMQDWVIQVRI